MQTMTAQRKSTLTAADIQLFQQEAELKARLAAIKDVTDAKRKELIDSLGAGVHTVAGHVLELKVSYRDNVSWKSVAYAVAPEDKINRAKPEFTSNVEVIGLKVLS